MFDRLYEPSPPFHWVKELQCPWQFAFHADGVLWFLTTQDCTRARVFSGGRPYGCWSSSGEDFYNTNIDGSLLRTELTQPNDIVSQKKVERNYDGLVVGCPILECLSEHELCGSIYGNQVQNAIYRLPLEPHLSFRLLCPPTRNLAVLHGSSIKTTLFATTTKSNEIELRDINGSLLNAIHLNNNVVSISPLDSNQCISIVESSDFERSVVRICLDSGQILSSNEALVASSAAGGAMVAAVTPRLDLVLYDNELRQFQQVARCTVKCKSSDEMQIATPAWSNDNRYVIFSISIVQGTVKRIERLMKSPDIRIKKVNKRHIEDALGQKVAGTLLNKEEMMFEQPRRSAFSRSFVSSSHLIIDTQLRSVWELVTSKQAQNGSICWRPKITERNLNDW